ncbi:MAG: exopolysaccharide Pel transporter PelG, partial [Burkholderiaceae bacterium]
RNGGSLALIERLRNGMVESARMGLQEIIKIQAITALVVIIAGGDILNWLGISPLYGPLLNVMVVGAGMQVVLLGILNLLFYLDRRHQALAITGLFLLLNALGTLIGLRLGPEFYGYGYAGALLITCVVGTLWLDYEFENLEYRTFMLQRGT